MRPYALIGILLVGAQGTGCVMAPALPGGPLQGTSVQGEAASALGYAPGTVTENSLDGSSDKTDGSGWMGLTIGRVGGRLGVNDWLDTSLDYSWADWGFEARVGLPEWTPLPFAVSLSQRYGTESVGAGHEDHFERRVRGEVYPHLWTKQTARAHLIASLGVSMGDRVQPLDETAEFWLIREETRLEGALGLEVRNRFTALSVGALPYFVLDHGAAYDLEGVSDVDLDRTFGVTLFIKLGLSFTFHRFTGGILPERQGSERQGLGE